MVLKESKPSTALKNIISTIRWWNLGEFLYSILLDNIEEKSDIW